MTSGTAGINQSGNTTNINQSTQKASINWQGFSIAGNETVNFNQPNSSALTLNRVIGNERSAIDGALNANGQVFLINSAGVLFGNGSSVNVGGLVASTRDLSDADFNAGNYVFKGNGRGSVINFGTLTARGGGYVALLGNSVSNQGVISATKGTVAMSAGDKITLNFNGDSLLSVTLDEGTLNALVENKQAIYADGGTVYLTAKAADELLSVQVNNTGLIQARTIDDLKGRITLYAHGGTANVGGTLDASAPNSGDSGFIETSGDRVKIADTAQILTRSAHGANGSWLIDPVDFTIAASGGDMTGAYLSNYLNTQGSTTIQSSSGSRGSNGDINVNDAITWSSNNSLTLTAVHDININNAITINGASAQLVMNYGNDYNIRTKASYAGAVLDAHGNPVARRDTSGGVYGSVTFNNNANTNGLTINGNAYTLVHSLNQLDALDGNNAITGAGTASTVSGRYALARNLDAAGTTYANALVTSFTGTFTGLGHTVSNLTINAPTTDYVGLIGLTQGTTVLRDIGVVNANVSGATGVGALLGRGDNGTTVTVRNAYSTGSVSGDGQVGGLAGIATIVEYAYSTANVSGAYAGGLASIVTTSVTHAHATGNVSTAGGSGGLLSSFGGTAVDYVYATGNVTGIGPSATGLGGLIGSVSPSGASLSVKNSFATGNVSGQTQLGGLIGKVAFTGSMAGRSVLVQNTYATGDVTSISSTTPANNGSGGLIGVVTMGAWGSSATKPNFTVAQSHASGNVTLNVTGGTSSAFAGGLIGNITGSVTGNPCCGKLGSIIDSYATGVVNASGSGLTVLLALGGLVGSTQQTNITGSYAAGNVRGGANTIGNIGGLGGVVNYANVSNTYATGLLSGNARTGGLIGNAQDVGGTVTNSYFKAQNSVNACGLGSACGTTTGLSNEQIADAKYYANGTINQVLADRAAAEAAARAAAEAAAKAAAEAAAQAAREQAFRNEGGKVAGTEVAQSLNAPPRPTVLAENSLHSPAATALDQNIVFSSSEYAAYIRRIEVDGKVFLLEDEEARKKKLPDAQPQ